MAFLVWKAFELMALRDTKVRSRFSKNIHFRSLSLRKSASVNWMVFCSVQVSSRLDTQSKFPMFTVFSGRHIGGLTEVHQLGVLGSLNLRKTFHKRRDLPLKEMPSLLISHKSTIPWLYPLYSFQYIFSLRDRFHCHATKNTSKTVKKTVTPNKAKNH